ncbi:MAG TPA: rod shape-determining protein RodA [Acidimicrobiales bacterium]|nr:rod shape-determining protein RodA [Acidimicrobiales bacterium]
MLGTRPTARVSISTWRHIDTPLIAAVVATASLGLLMVFSATRHQLAEAGLDEQSVLKRQAVFVLLGVLAMAALTTIDYRNLRAFAPLIFGGAVVLLLLVLSPLGSEGRGTQAWFQLGAYQFQPSEFSKIAVVVCAAAYCATYREGLGAREVGAVLGLAAIPIGLIYLQPDLGTALVFIAILLGVLAVGGARPRHLGVLVALGIVAVIAVLQLGVLKQYQLDRLGAFLDPTDNSLQASYNLNQSKIAIGSGGLTGKGLFEGSQTTLAYVPEQSTDFVFTVVGEELGFAGSAILLTLFGFIVWRIWRAATVARDLFGTLVCVGVLCMFVFQIFENIGMTMGIMPITGIPLPFVSYGGSSIVAAFAGLGLVLNVHMRRFA